MLMQQPCHGVRPCTQLTPGKGRIEGVVAEPSRAPASGAYVEDCVV